MNAALDPVARGLATHVDGQPVTPDSPDLSVSNVGNFHYLTVDFGDDAQTLRANFSISSGGSGGGAGYRPCDTVTIVGARARRRAWRWRA